MTTPPIAKQVDHVWERPTGSFHDRYAWLRDRDDPDTIAYLEAESAYADAWFDERSTLVEELYDEIKRRTQETDQGVPIRHRDWWYVSRTEEGASYAVHCRGRSAATATEQVLLDENAEAAGHEYFQCQAFDVRPDHRLLAWSSDTDGSERYTLRIRDLDTGDDLADEIPDTTWGGTAWAGDWLFYVTPDEQMRPEKVWRHRLGTDPAGDVLVFHEPDQRFYLSVGLSRSEQWIVIDASSNTTSEVHLIRASDPAARPSLVRAKEEGHEYHLDDWGDRFVVHTNLDAEDFRVMTAPLDAPGEWSPLVPHVPGRRITNVEAFADRLVIHEWSEAQPRLSILGRADAAPAPLTVGPDGLSEPHDVELEANPDWNASTLRYVYMSLTTPVSVYEHDFATGAATLLKRTPTPNVDLDRYESRRLWAAAPDATLVPLDVVHLRGAEPDGSAPCLLYGYGSYEASMPPWFSVARLGLVDRGFTWALAHPRGGGELGRRWYLDGKLLNKRNTFTDTIACAEHLVDTGWAAPGRVGLRGGSAGGLLVGACMNLRPELFGAAVAEVPFVDVVTTMHDETLPLTVIERDEWGDPREEPWASYMLSYSPYDNVVAAEYPPTYVTAGLNDPRVSFHEPAKWVAKLRSVTTGDALLLFKCEMGAGHGGPSGRYGRWRDEAKVHAFLLETLSP